MPRKDYKFHYIYKTVNNINGKYYIGMHSTNYLEDDYIGSGQILWHSIKKYGRENFKKDILEFFPDRKSLGLREKEIVTKEIVADPLCMNLKLGGEYSPGTFGKKYSEESRKKMSEWKRPKELCENISKKLLKRSSINREQFGKGLSPEHCKSISESKTGTHLSEEHKQHIAAWEITDEWREKQRNSVRGRTCSEEAKQNMRKPKSEAGKQNMRVPHVKHNRKSQEIVTCTKCGKKGQISSMKRWHFDNCGKIVHLSEENKQKLRNFYLNKL